MDKNSKNYHDWLLKAKKEGVIIDYGKDGKVIGIEILDASEYLATNELATVKFDANRVLTRK